MTTRVNGDMAPWTMDKATQPGRRASYLGQMRARGVNKQRTLTMTSHPPLSVRCPNT